MPTKKGSAVFEMSLMRNLRTDWLSTVESICVVTHCSTSKEMNF